jgi:AcrR family transcriptional regulator
MLEKPIEQIRIREITDAIFISRGTFYIHYDSVYTVLQEIEDEYFESSIHAFSEYLSYPCHDRYFNEPHPAAVIAISFIRNNALLHRAMMGEYGDYTFQRRWEKLIRTFIVDRAIKEGYIVGKKEYLELVSEIIIGAQRSTFLTLSKREMPFTDEDYAVYLYRVLFSPFRMDYSRC